MSGGIHLTTGQDVKDGCLAALGQANDTNFGTHKYILLFKQGTGMSAAFFYYFPGPFEGEVSFVYIHPVISGKIK